MRGITWPTTGNLSPTPKPQTLNPIFGYFSSKQNPDPDIRAHGAQLREDAGPARYCFNSNQSLQPLKADSTLRLRLINPGAEH